LASQAFHTKWSKKYSYNFHNAPAPKLLFRRPLRRKIFRRSSATFFHPASALGGRGTLKPTFTRFICSAQRIDTFSLAALMKSFRRILRI
jgi:hypothetical protein